MAGGEAKERILLNHCVSWCPKNSPAEPDRDKPQVCRCPRATVIAKLIESRRENRVDRGHASATLADYGRARCWIEIYRGTSRWPHSHLTFGRGRHGIEPVGLPRLGSRRW